MDGVRRTWIPMTSPFRSRRILSPQHLHQKVIGPLLLAVLLGGCGPTHVLVLVNRSDSTIAFYPEVVVPACSSMGLSEEQLRVAKDAFLEALGNDDQSWIPAGAKQFTAGVAPRPLGAPDPQTVIVSGTDVPRSVDGVVLESELPACGGEPVGID